MKFKKVVALLLSSALIFASFTACNTSTDSSQSNETQSQSESQTDSQGESQSNSQEGEDTGNSGIINAPEGYGLTENIEDGAILHCFSWSFKTIKESLEDIAAAGFSAIQTSPVNLCYDGGEGGMDLFGSGKWYYHYQPTDWTIGNYQLGTKEEFVDMCKAADEMGIKVIVDVVPNHTTTNQVAVAETFYDAVGGKDKLYHKNGLETISNYSDRKQCTLWAMGGLNDVNTENPKFQDYFIKFLNECISCGVDGFRYDTAKHIGLPSDPKDDEALENNFWERVTTEIDKADVIFNYGEVLQGDGDRITAYIDAIGATTASSYGYNIRNAAITKNLKASKMADFCVSGKTDVVTWVESHDNYTEDGGSATNLNNNHIIIGWSVIAARAEGTPLFFSRPYGSSKDNMWGTFNKIGMAGDNLYKDPTIVAVNRFRNAMVGEPEKLYNVDGYNPALFIERGEKGLVIINSASTDYKFTTETALKDGKYLNRVDNTTEYTVEGGKISGEVKAGSVVVLCNDGYADVSALPVVKVADGTDTGIIGDVKKVTLFAENIKSATYSIDGGDEVAFKNGDTVDVGDGVKALECTTLTLKGVNEDGNSTCITYIFKKMDSIGEGTTISFVKPDSWGDKISAYVYDETTYSKVKENAGWPGVTMTDNGDGTYTYTFTEEWVAPLVIFTDGKNQSGGQLEPGAEVVPGKVYTAN